MEQINAIPLEAILRGRDLTDPAEGAHPVQALVADAHRAVAGLWECPRRLLRPSPFEPVGCGDQRRLHPRRRMLDALPRLISAVALDPPEDVLLVAPGPVLPVTAAVPEHCLALLRLTVSPVGSVELGRMLQAVIRSLLPHRSYRLMPERDAALGHAMRIEGLAAHGWTEIGRCGVVRPPVLRQAGLPPEDHRALALELGLERILSLADDRALHAEPARNNCQQALAG